LEPLQLILIFSVTRFTGLHSFLWLTEQAAQRLRAVPAIGHCKGEKEMQANVGGVDRGIRIVVGIVLLLLSFLHVVTGALAIVAYIVGAVALITGIVRFCPAWAVLGIGTGSAKRN
jgi:hypothetical protein